VIISNESLTLTVSSHLTPIDIGKQIIVSQHTIVARGESVVAVMSHYTCRARARWSGSQVGLRYLFLISKRMRCRALCACADLIVVTPDADR